MDESVKEVLSSKKVIIIGNLSLEGVTDKIVALGHTYKKRNPFSLPENWTEIQKNIHQLKESGELLAVIMYLTPGLIRHSREPKYQDGNLTLWLKSWGRYDRKSTESSNLTFFPSSHAAPDLRFRSRPL
jgi:hypothetical protein